MEKNKKQSALWVRVANIVTIIICLFVLIIAIAAITNSVKGYNYFFGSTLLAVESDSMEGNNKDSFDKHDMIVARLLSDKKKKELEVGDVITFWTFIDNQRELNTHRIIAVEDGQQKAYVTKGDNKPDEDDQRVMHSEVVAKYQFKVKNFGKALLFMQGPTGFLIMVVIPSLLALAYCVFIFIKNLKTYNKLKKDEEKEKIKKELLAEQNVPEEKASEKADDIIPDKTEKDKSDKEG